jgi:hypothetical protein
MRRLSPSQARWLVLLVALAPFAILAAHHWSWTPPAFAGDFAQYLSHARAIVEGKRYGDIGYLYHPGAWVIGPPAYPPGLPLTLAPVVALFGVHSPLVRLLMLASLALCAFFAWRRLSSDMPPWQAAVGAGMAAFAIESALGTLGPMSDPGFCALFWAVILAVDWKGDWSWRRVAVVTALGFAAISYRAPGVAIVPALGLYALVTWRGHRGRAAIPAAIWSAAGAAYVVMNRGNLPYVDGIGASFATITGRLNVLSRQYRLSMFRLEGYPFGSDSWNDAYHIIVSLLLFVGLGIVLWRARRSFLAALSITYVVMLLVSPVSESRYLWPLYPLMGAAIVVALATLTGWVERVWRTVPAAAVPGALMTLAAVGALLVELGRARPRSLLGDPETEALFTWLRAASDSASMRIAFHNPRVLTLETRIPAMGHVRRTSPGFLAAWAERRITHFVWQRDEVSECPQRMANRLPALRPDRFVLEYSNATYRVYRVALAPSDVDEPYEQLHYSQLRTC